MSLLDETFMSNKELKDQFAEAMEKQSNWIKTSHPEVVMNFFVTMIYTYGDLILPYFVKWYQQALENESETRRPGNNAAIYLLHRDLVGIIRGRMGQVAGLDPEEIPTAKMMKELMEKIYLQKYQLPQIISGRDEKMFQKILESIFYGKRSYYIEELRSFFHNPTAFQDKIDILNQLQTPGQDVRCPKCGKWCAIKVDQNWQSDWGGLEADPDRYAYHFGTGKKICEMSGQEQGMKLSDDYKSEL